MIPMSLTLWNKYIYITPNTLNNGVYNKNKSSSFNTTEKDIMGDQRYYRKGDYCTELFSFDSNGKIKNEKTQFILTHQMEYSTEYRKGLIGFQLTTYKAELTLINQLKSKEIINSYYHFMEFSEDDEGGTLVIGAPPHEIFPSKYSYNDFRQVNAREVTQSWDLYMTNIKYDNETFDNSYFELDFNFGMISVGSALKLAYYNDFFSKRIKAGLCKEVLYEDYYIYSCIDDDDKVKFNELKDFHFYSHALEYDFVLSSKDLFVTFNKRKYFLVTYKINSMTKKFGKPFFKKYTIIFNPDNKQIGHYVKVNKEVEKNNDNNNNSDEEDRAYIVPIIIISVLIVSMIVFGIILFKNFKRKKKINEIDDKFEYISEEDNNMKIN